MNLKATILFSSALVASAFLFAQQPGTLDGDFDANGSVITSITSDPDGANSVVVQPDGKIVVAGRAGLGFFNVPSDYATVRYLPDGSLDASFGTNGIVTADLGTLDHANSIALQTDGKIVVGGTSTGIISSEAFALVRYHQDGTIDNSFSTTDQDGLFTGPLGECEAIAIQSDGKIVAAGRVSTSSYDFRLARYNIDGTIDNTFGPNGVVTTDLGGLDDVLRSIAIQPDGKIVVAGLSDNGANFDFAVARYNSDGSLDNGFSFNGVVSTDFGGVGDGARSVLLQPDGKIVVVGITTASPVNFRALARYNADGTLDNTFGVNGKVVTMVAGVSYSSVLQPDGKIIVVGGLDAIDLMRYHVDGTLDTDFGVNGIAEANIGLSGSSANSCDLQPDGKIVVAGSAHAIATDDVGFAVARFITGLNLGVVSFSKQDNAMLVYPNPVQERAVLKYTLSTTETISIDLYDVSGKLVQSLVQSEKRTKGPQKETLVIDSSIPAGTYILTLSNGVGSSSVRISK
ncbi:T9SS type A sorting domain-containing protein [Cryomorphaceae bacterium 1068]|nr:T9SS type A sorting domain-containing protein [Cryomorphaceae bacterium 1068]